MNPSAVARAGTTSAPMTKCGAVYAIAIKMDTILDMSQISNRFVRNGRKIMSDYISREDAVDELQVKVFHNLTDEYYGTMQVLNELPAADVVSKADLKALLEETEKELVKGTDEMSIARCFIVSIMGIVKCKIMQMGEKKE